MGKAKKPKKVTLVIGMLSKDKKLFDKAEEFFIKDFGPIDYRSPALLFKYTDYYEREMGAGLKRVFISFKKLISPEKISKIKLLANSVEEKLAKNNKRRINLDPGYVSDAKLILATTKDYCHRIYLTNGIYAEVTLKWRRDGFEPFEWTYPDYQSREYIDIFNTLRKRLCDDSQ